MFRKTMIATLVSLLAAVSAAQADHLQKGDREIAFRFSYVNFDFEGPGGDVEVAQLDLSFGYMLTDHHEVFGILGWLATEGYEELALGGAYTYNFRAGRDLNPYLAVRFFTFEGDVGDIFDYSYGAEAGVKLYPWSHGGFIFGLGYRKMIGADGGQDRTDFAGFSGLIVKF